MDVRARSNKHSVYQCLVVWCPFAAKRGVGGGWTIDLSCVDLSRAVGVPGYSALGACLFEEDW